MRIALLISLMFVACGPESGDSVVEKSTPLAVSTTAPLRAQLDFQPDWVQVQHGAIEVGGHVDVTYARSRMSACPSPTVFSYALFQPGRQLYSSDESFGFEVPADAVRVELWFHSVSPGCEQWDSNYGRNWQFPVGKTATEMARPVSLTGGGAEPVPALSLAPPFRRTGPAW